MKIDRKFEEVLNHIQKGSCETLVTNTVDDVDVYLIVETFRRTNKTIFLLTSNVYHAQRMYDKINQIIDESDLEFFPADELITTELLAASKEFSDARIKTIRSLLRGEPKIVITHTTGILRRERPKEIWMSNLIELNVNDVHNQKSLVRKLSSLGFERNFQVEKQGEFSVRGYIVDIYLSDYNNPVRVEFFDDEIDSIREFDVVTKRSLNNLQNVVVFPMSEVLLSTDEKQSIIDLIKSKDLDESTELDLITLEEGGDSSKIHKYLQFVSNSPITTFVDNPTLFIYNPKRVKDTYMTMIEDVKEWYLSVKHNQSLQLDFIYDIFHVLALNKTIVYLQEVLTSEFNYDSTFNLHTKEVIDYQGNLKLFVDDIKKEKRTVVLQNKKSIKSLLDDSSLEYKIISDKDEIVQGEINLVPSTENYSFESEKILCISEENIFRKKKKEKKHIRIKEATKLKSINELVRGDYVVHFDYGIGRYLGIKSMEIGGIVNDYIHVEYREDEMLYVPVENINMIQKYIGSEGARPRLNSIGGASWAKTKARVKKKIKDIAGKLIKLYAERKEATGFAFMEDQVEQAEFEADFLYSETKDQLKAVEDVKYDMEQAYPMDRLICGDVGYGKTEVAMRAAFKAVQSLKQVAYLCPTTVLSKQHFKTFRERFHKYGVRVELINRFVTKGQQTKILRDLEAGKVDIIIGTHRLLGNDVIFDDVGLLIIDEEQRFGVEHKEKIKEYKVSIDVLTLSATPIPRTLQMSLMGVKSTSLLETPPLNRYPVQTYVLEQNMSVIKDAVERELARGGQIFVLYNRVSDIEIVTNRIQRLVKDARVTFAHGQMRKEDLDDRMNDFVDKKYDLLVCTTIIETGLDIPNANTLIILDADRLGLSQLYQIRGRVGRSDRIAYAYLMYKKNKVTETAEKRLAVIKEFTELGSGFKIALRDLNIRGAGDVLGAEQSGFMDSVGFDLYMQMLDEEIKEQQGEKNESPAQNTSTNIKVSKHIPDEYTEFEENKIEIHRMIKEVSNLADINNLILSLKDQYGYVPEHLITFMDKTLFDKHAEKYQLDMIKDQPKYFEMRFSRESSNNVDGEKLLLSAFKISRNINLFYKNNRVLIKYDKENKDYLRTMNAFFEEYNKTLEVENNPKTL